MLESLNPTKRVEKLRQINESTEKKAMRMYADYYDGHHFVKTAESQSDYGKNHIYRLETRSGVQVFDDYDLDDRIPVKTNYCRPIVNTIADYTRGVNDPISIITENKNIDTMWKNSLLSDLVLRTAYEAGVYGKTYWRYKKTEKEKVYTVDPTEIHEVIDPVTGERESVIHFYEISGKDAEKYGIKPSDTSVYYAEEWTDKELRKYIDGNLLDREKIINPYNFIPFFKIESNEFETADVVDVIPLNDELNITLTYINEILRYHAFPLYSPDGKFDGNTLPKQALQDVEISPKTIMNFPLKRIEGKGVDQSILDYIKDIKRDISVVSGVPEKVLTADIDGNLSGVAIQRILGTTFKRAETRRGNIENAIRQIHENLVPGIETEVVFPPMVRIDENERLQEALSKIAIGISKKTVLEELGYDYDEEKKNKEEDLDNMMMTRINDEQGIQSNNKSSEDEGAQTDKRGSRA